MEIRFAYPMNKILHTIHPKYYSSLPQIVVYWNEYPKVPHIWPFPVKIWSADPSTLLMANITHNPLRSGEGCGTNYKHK